MTTDTARDTVQTLTAELRMTAGRSGTTEFLEMLKALDVYALQTLIEHPQPMFFKDAWDEIFDVLLAEAAKP